MNLLGRWYPGCRLEQGLERLHTTQVPGEHDGKSALPGLGGGARLDGGGGEILGPVREKRERARGGAGSLEGSEEGLALGQDEKSEPAYTQRESRRAASTKAGERTMPVAVMLSGQMSCTQVTIGTPRSFLKASAGSAWMTGLSWYTSETSRGPARVSTARAEASPA